MFKNKFLIIKSNLRFDVSDLTVVTRISSDENGTISKQTGMKPVLVKVESLHHSHLCSCFIRFCITET